MDVPSSAMLMVLMLSLALIPSSINAQAPMSSPTSMSPSIAATPEMMMASPPTTMSTPPMAMETPTSSPPMPMGPAMSPDMSSPPSPMAPEMSPDMSPGMAPGDMSGMAPSGMSPGMAPDMAPGASDSGAFVLGSSMALVGLGGALALLF